MRGLGGRGEGAHPEMKPLGLEHLWEVLGVEPEFYVHSIANRRDQILLVELYTHIHTYTHMHVMGDVLNCFAHSLDVTGET